MLAVNGRSVAGRSYSDVVAAIQKTPKTLTLQVVPKSFDILQTIFSDTAHNPETNQRPLQGFSQQSFQEKQESLYSTLHELAQAKSLEQQHGKQKENVPMIPGDPKIEYSESAVMSRMRKSLEQKEEFLRRPSQPYVYNSLPLPMLQPPKSFQTTEQNFRTRLKPSWPPNYDFNHPAKQAVTSTSSQDLSSAGSPSYTNSRLNNQLALREQFFNSTYSPPASTYSLTKLASPSPLFSSTPTSPHLLEPPNPNAHQSLGGSAGNIIEKSSLIEGVEKRMSPLMPVTRIVDNLTKQFETGRPLSPDGIADRTAFHKSELSR